MEERDRQYRLTLPLFDEWLVGTGFKLLIADRLSADLEEQRQRAEDAAYVTPQEIQELVERWPPYRGMRITSEQVRSWLNQLERHTEQRILFKLLGKVRFFSLEEVVHKFAHAGVAFKHRLPIFVQREKVRQRDDIWVTYVDGVGKSGAQYARAYVDGNSLRKSCVKEMAEVDKLRDSSQGATGAPRAIIVVDDFIGSGESLSDGLAGFYKRNRQALYERKILVLVAVICATPKANCGFEAL